jgi:hypothetical protein
VSPATSHSDKFFKQNEIITNGNMKMLEILRSRKGANLCKTLSECSLENRKELNNNALLHSKYM